MTKAARFRLLAVVYGSQFIPLAFCLYALGAVLRERGVALERIAVLQLAALAWVAKFAWAPLVDRFGSRLLGHYRGWLLGTQVLMVGGLLALMPLDVVGDLPLVLVVVGAIAVVSATQDIAADATMVRLLAPAERGAGNGIQKAGGYLGLLIGGGGALVAYDLWGWVPALALLATLTASPLPFLLAYREPGTGPAAPRPVSFRTMGGFFRRPGVVRWVLGVLPAYLAGIAVALPLVTPLLVDAGWPLSQVGAVSVVGGGAVAIVAALAAGALLSAVRRRRALIGFALTQVAAIGALLLLVLGSSGLLPAVAAVGLLNAASAAAGTVVYTVNMDWTRPSSAGTDYTLQDSVSHLYQHVLGATVLGHAGALGYPGVLAVASVLGVAGVAVAARVFREPALADPVEVPGDVRRDP